MKLFTRFWLTRPRHSMISLNYRANAWGQMQERISYCDRNFIPDQVDFPVVPISPCTDLFRCYDSFQIYL